MVKKHYKELLKTADINFVNITKGVDSHAKNVTILQSRAEQSRAEQSRAEQGLVAAFFGIKQNMMMMDNRRIWWGRYALLGSAAFLCFKGAAATITAVNKDIKEIGTYED